LEEDIACTCKVEKLSVRLSDTLVTATASHKVTLQKAAVFVSTTSRNLIASFNIPLPWPFA